MDPLTLQYYEKNAGTLFDRYESVDSGIAAFFQASFPPGGIIVDIGAGSGRDMRRLLDLVYDAYGVEPTEAFRNLVETRQPSLKGRLWPGKLPDLVLPHQADGVVCSAVLMHLPEGQLFDAMVALREGLKVHGRLLLSIPRDRPGLDESHRDGEQRLFQPIESDRLVLLAERLGLRLLSRWENTDGLQRTGHEWVTLLFEKSAQTGRPLDRIESVLNRGERKVATYKLALIRGLCDLATADDHLVDWGRSGMAGVPVLALAERWLFYYWPLFASPEFIPQIQGESSDSAKPIKFRRSLSTLIGHYQSLGGLDAFSLDYRSGRLDTNAQKLVKKTVQDILYAIIQGPVKFAAQGNMFHYDTATRRVYCDAALWQEICLTGYWIRDALILRWADLTTHFAPHLNMGIVLECLLREPVVDREVQVARNCYLAQKELRCIWSDRLLNKEKLAVDHALPFALWRNNDLWNLLPSHHSVNSDKSDKVPTPAVLERRKEAIIHCWTRMHLQEPKLFEYEVTRLLGSALRNDWENHLFGYFKRNAEYGIFLRGAKPWEGAKVS